MTDAAGNTIFEVVHGEGTDEPALYTGTDGVMRALLQDRVGSVQGVVGPDGSLDERYTSSPYGKLTRHEPPKLDSARLEGGALVLRLTDEADPAAAESAISTTPGTEGEWRISTDGRELSFFPPDKSPKDDRRDWPETGSVAVAVSRGLRAWTGLALLSAASFSFAADDLSDRVIGDRGGRPRPRRHAHVDRIGAAGRGSRLGASPTGGPGYRGRLDGLARERWPHPAP